MTHYYLGIGYGNTYSVGMLDHKPTIPMLESDLISDLEFHLADDPFDYDAVLAEKLATLQDGDTLVVRYPNQAALYILDEWAEDFDIPNNQREEIYTVDGLQKSHVFFENADDEDWIWLADADVDYYDDNDRPVPVYPADDDEEELIQ